MQVINSANEIKERATDWFDSATDYLETRWNLGVLDLSEKSAQAISSIATTLIISTVGTITLIFASLGIAWMIGEALNSPAKGFFIVGGFYALVGIILLLVKDKFIRLPIINSFIKRFNYGS